MRVIFSRDPVLEESPGVAEPRADKVIYVQFKVGDVIVALRGAARSTTTQAAFLIVTHKYVDIYSRVSFAITNVTYCFNITIYSLTNSVIFTTYPLLTIFVYL